MKRLALLVALTFTCFGAWAIPGPTAQQRSLKPITHVVLVMMENKNVTAVAGHMPYLDSLNAKYADLANYWATNYPSNPNYMRLTSGTSTPSGDCQPASNCQNTGPSIFGQTSWQVWAESMKGNCALKNQGTLYVPRHTAAPYYTQIRSSCQKNDVPLPANPTISAHFTLVAPNMCHDMHNCSVSAGDSWLKGWLPRLLNQPAFTDGSTVIEVTWDSGSNNCGSNCQSHVWLVIMNPRLSKLTVTQKFTHDGLLRLNEDLLKLPPLGGAKNAGGLKGLLGL